MGRYPPVSGKKAVRVFESWGWTVSRQKGSHISMTKEGCKRPVVIPDHKEVREGTLASSLRTAGKTRSEFHAALQDL